MPTFLLNIRMELDGIQRLIPIEDNLWKFNVESQDGQLKREGVTIYQKDVFEIEGGRGEANFVMKWDKKNPQQSWIKIIDHRDVKHEYNASNSGEWVSVLALECRGLELSEWCPGVDFLIESKGGKIFSNVDLSEKDWAEYDEENDISLSFLNFEYALVRI